PERFPLSAMVTPEAMMTSEAGRLSLLVAFLITQLLVIGVSLLAIRLFVGRDWPRHIGLRLPSPGQTLLVLAAFPALVLLANGSYELLKRLGVPSLGDHVPGMEQMMEVFSAWPLALAVLIIGVGPGIGEELWCRAFLGRGLVGRYGVVWGVVLTSFFFGAIHVDPRQGTMAMIMGVVLHFVYLTTRSLWMPMLLHFLNNSFAVMVTRFPHLEDIDKDPGFIPWYVFAAAGLLLAAAGVALYRGRARVAGPDVDRWLPPYPNVIWPPEGSASRI